MGANRDIRDEIGVKLQTSLRTFAARCAGESWNFHQVAPVISRAMRSGRSFEHKVIMACLEQFQQNKQYSPQSIALAIGASTSDVLTLAKEDAEIDLKSACEIFRLYFGQAMELTLADNTESYLLQGMSSEEIAVASANFRRENGLSQAMSTDDGIEAFEKKLLLAIEGVMPTFAVTPFLEGLRREVGGYEGGDYIVVVALTGQGKSYYALNQLVHCAKAGTAGLYVNLENTPANVQKRIWQMECGKKFSHDLRASDAEMRNYLDVWESIKKLPIKSVNPGRTLQRVVSTIRQEWYERGIGFAAIDYAQLMSIDGNRKNRNYELDEISAEFRALSLELKIPIIALAQAKQEVSKTATRRVDMYDVKDCAGFAQDATFVQTLYRPGYFGITQRELPGGGSEPYEPDYADVMIAKGRETGPMLVPCRFDPVKGFYDAPAQTQFPLINPAIENKIINSARPMAEDDIPF